MTNKELIGAILFVLFIAVMLVLFAPEPKWKQEQKKAKGMAIIIKNQPLLINNKLENGLNYFQYEGHKYMLITDGKGNSLVCVDCCQKETK